MLAAATQLSPWLPSVTEGWVDGMPRSHGQLIQGPRGVGKLNFALVMANRLLGVQGSEEPLSADGALALMNSPAEESKIHPDLHWLAPKKPGGTIGVDDVRELTQALALTPFLGDAKVALIEPAEAMTMAAHNALLKTLEEPSGSGHLLLVTHRSGVLPATIVSRCSRTNIAAVDRGEALEWLAGWGQVSEEEWEKVLQVCPGPWRALQLVSNGFLNKINKWEKELNLISGKKEDPLNVASQWIKDDPEMSLEWFISQLESAIRAAHQPSNPVTDLANPRLHNVFDDMTLPSKFDLLDQARSLARSIGTGANTEQGMRAMLLALADQGHRN